MLYVLNQCQFGRNCMQLPGVSILNDCPSIGHDVVHDRMAVQGTSSFTLHPILERKRISKRIPSIRARFAPLHSLALQVSRLASTKDCIFSLRKGLNEGVKQWHQMQEEEIKRQKAEAWRKRVEALRSSDMGVRGRHRNRAQMLVMFEVLIALDTSVYLNMYFSQGPTCRPCLAWTSDMDMN